MQIWRGKQGDHKDHKDGDHKEGDHKEGDHKDHKEGDHKGEDMMIIFGPGHLNICFCTSSLVAHFTMCMTKSWPGPFKYRTYINIHHAHHRW